MPTKQISLRLNEDVHAFIVHGATKTNQSLTDYVTTLICCNRDIYQTNYSNRIQVRFSLTYLGDLLVLGQKDSFNGVYQIMEESIEQGYEVVIERHYQNAPPTELKKFNSLEEINDWKQNMLSI
ncbi:hypothetical protein [Bacillus sp. REN10]|uniref:hypothetical protein n=1 Tax=Bacillus sp. REN10 TaxID=2782541 RepID=UPI00193B06ED|nr:hypothetical protein [Bacillus sp. REN10]